MPNDIRTQQVPTEKFKDLEIGAVFRFRYQEDQQDTYLKIQYSREGKGCAVSLKTGELCRGDEKTKVYRVKKVTLTSPGEDYV